MAVDESDGARAALSWAAHEAALRGSRLQLVHVFEAHVTYNPVSAIKYKGAVEEAEGPAEELVARLAADAEALAGGGVTVLSLVLQGDPAQRLVDISAQADLLVMGTRGRSGLASLLLGSVSQHCLQHAACPVVIVPPAAQLES